MNTVTQAQTPTFQPVTRTNTNIPVLDYVSAIIGELVRAGALFDLVTENIAIRQLAEACKIKELQAREAWIEYMTKNAATLVG